MIPKSNPAGNPGLFIVPSGTKASELQATPPDVPQSLHEFLYQVIESKRMIRFRYSGKLRIVEPHDYGMLKGRARLFSYQIAGESGTGHLPDWRLFDVPKISNFEVLDRSFPGNRPVPSGKHHEWEKVFIRVAEPE